MSLQRWGRHQSKAAEGQQGLPASARSRKTKDSFLLSHRGGIAFLNLSFGLQTSRTVGGCISVVLSLSLLGIYYGSPRELTQIWGQEAGSCCNKYLIIWKWPWHWAMGRACRNFEVHDRKSCYPEDIFSRNIHIQETHKGTVYLGAKFLPICGWVNWANESNPPSNVNNGRTAVGYTIHSRCVNWKK